MSLLAFLRGDTLDYASKNIKVNLGQLTLSPCGGKVWNPNEIGNFSCSIANLGLMLVSGFRIHIYTNEYGKIKMPTDYNWTSDLKLGPFTIGPNKVLNLPLLQFKAIKKTNGTKDVIFSYIEDFELVWNCSQQNSSLFTLESKDKLAIQI